MAWYVPRLQLNRNVKLTLDCLQGQSKRDFMDKELGSGTVELMRTIKKAIDPDDLFK